MSEFDIRWGDSATVKQDTRAVGSFELTSNDLIYVAERGQPRVWHMTTSVVAHIPTGTAIALFEMDGYVGAGSTILRFPMPPPAPLVSDAPVIFSQQFPAATVRVRCRVKIVVSAPGTEDFQVNVTSIIGPLVAYSDYERRKDTY